MHLFISYVWFMIQLRPKLPSWNLGVQCLASKLPGSLWTGCVRYCRWTSVSLVPGVLPHKATGKDSSSLVSRRGSDGNKNRAGAAMKGWTTSRSEPRFHKVVWLEVVWSAWMNGWMDECQQCCELGVALCKDATLACWSGSSWPVSWSGAYWGYWPVSWSIAYRSYWPVSWSGAYWSYWPAS